VRDFKKNQRANQKIDATVVPGKDGKVNLDINIESVVSEAVDGKLKREQSPLRNRREAQEAEKLRKEMQNVSDSVEQLNKDTQKAHDEDVAEDKRKETSGESVTGKMGDFLQNLEKTFDGKKFVGGLQSGIQNLLNPMKATEKLIGGVISGTVNMLGKSVGMVGKVLEASKAEGGVVKGIGGMFRGWKSAVGSKLFGKPAAVVEADKGVVADGSGGLKKAAGLVALQTAFYSKPDATVLGKFYKTIGVTAEGIKDPYAKKDGGGLDGLLGLLPLLAGALGIGLLLRDFLGEGGALSFFKKGDIVTGIATLLFGKDFKDLSGKSLWAEVGIQVLKGGAIGFALGGPVGALIGAVIGFVGVKVKALFQGNVEQFWEMSGGKLWEGISDKVQGMLPEDSKLRKALGKFQKLNKAERKRISKLIKEKGFFGYIKNEFNTLKTIFGNLGKGFGKIVESVKAKVADILSSVGGGLADAWGNLKTMLGKVWENIMGALGAKFTAIKEKLKTGKLGEIFQKLTGIVDKIKIMIQPVIDVFEKYIVKPFKALFSFLGKKLADLGGKAKDILKLFGFKFGEQGLTDEQGRPIPKANAVKIQKAKEEYQSDLRSLMDSLEKDVKTKKIGYAEAKDAFDFGKMRLDIKYNQGVDFGTG
jgi:hypothetical protein